MYIMNPIMYIAISSGCILCQHALEDCTIKFDRNSSKTLLSAGYNHFQVFDAVKVKTEGTGLCKMF